MVVIPTVFERSANTERVYDLYSCLLKERIILLTGEIEDNLSSSICAQLLYLASLSDEDIHIYINSPGGSISAGLAIYDTMQYIKNDVSTICIGICASMAAIIFAGGHAGKRYALENSEFMLHQPMGGIQGQAIDMEIAAKHIIRVKHKINKLLQRHTSQDLDTIIRDTDRDYFMDALEAKDYGLVDEVITNLHE